jgi:Right handed beta helix region/Pectinesterase
MPPVDRYESTFIVSLDPSQGDFTSLQDAISALPATGGKIFVKAGTYPLTNTVKITASNVQIQGEGMGITVFAGQSSMPGNAPALEAFSTASDGTPRTLLADTARGDLTIQLSPADAASFANGDFVLLFSNKGVDTESSPPHLKCAGEVKQIVTADPTTGLITMDDLIFDSYTQADSAQVVRITMLQNITLSDFSVMAQATSSQLRAGFTHFRFVENLQIERVEVHDAFFAGIQVQSVRGSAISGCYIHHINDIDPINPPNPANERNGIVVGGASQNVTISDCRFSHTRHSVTTGGSSGKNQNGVQRNLVVANCTSMLADTAHFDTHQPAENVTFTGCAAIGGVPVGGFPATNVVVGFQMRGRNCSIVGCSVLQAIGKGIMIFGPVSSGAVITGNMIANVKTIGNTLGVGIFFDSAGTSQHSVTGNVIKNCEGSAIEGVKSNNEIVLSGNVIENVNSVVPGAAIKLSNASRILIAGNNITASVQGPAIAMLGNSDNWRILGNSFGGGTGVALVGSGSVVTNNLGYNPVGNISNPWPSSGGDLTNTVKSGNPDPQSGVAYTVRHTAKSIVVTGGDVSQILINGADAGSTAGAFKLGVGEAITITYNTSAPATLVFAE